MENLMESAGDAVMEVVEVVEFVLQIHENVSMLQEVEQRI
jgi:hypothetical protein